MTCYHLIGPGCCATNHETGVLTAICHLCSGGNPQEVHVATKATTEFADEGCTGCWEEHLADEERRFWQKEWRRFTLAIICRWETVTACIASNIRRHHKWTRILAEREWKPKETSEYQTLLDLVLSEDIYLINYYGFVYVLICMFFRLFARSPAACRTERHRYNVRRLFGCTTCKRGSKEPRLPTTNYDTPTSSASYKKRGRMCTIYGRI